MCENDEVALASAPSVAPAAPSIGALRAGLACEIGELLGSGVDGARGDRDRPAAPVGDDHDRGYEKLAPTWASFDS